MKFTNTTSFPFQAIPCVTRDGYPVWTCVLKTCCELGGSQPWAGSARINFLDEYYGDRRTSSLRLANDISYFKPRCDIYFVDASARSKDGAPADGWEVSITVGHHRAAFKVESRSYWVRSSLTNRWTIEKGEAFTELPLRYEFAFGGSSPDKRKVWGHNPVGIGYIPEEDLQSVREIPCPQIVSCETTQPQKPCLMQTIAAGPLAGHWLPRRELAGTFDEKWRETRWPFFPNDSSDDHFCCAPSFLQVPGYLNGNEHFMLSGFTHDKPIEGKLPGGLSPLLLMPSAAGKVYWSYFNLDTLVINPGARSASATWRATVYRIPKMVDAIVLSNATKDF
jgi:hypothetical protein